MESKIYYECHVTVEPMKTDDEIVSFASICKKHAFEPAKLLMRKRAKDTPTRSQYDSFATGRSKYYDTLKTNMINLIEELVMNDIRVWRYKIEDTLLDSKYEGDVLSLIRSRA